MGCTTGTSKLNGTLSDDFSDTSIEFDDTDSECNRTEVISTLKGRGTIPKPNKVADAAISDCDDVEIVSTSNLQRTMASVPIEVSDSDKAASSECDEVEITSTSNPQCTTASEPIELVTLVMVRVILLHTIHVLTLPTFLELVLPPGVKGTWIDLTGSASGDEEMF